MIHLWRPLSRLYWVMQTAALFYFDGKRKKVRVRGILEKHETPTSQFSVATGTKITRNGNILRKLPDLHSLIPETCLILDASYSLSRSQKTERMLVCTFSNAKTPVWLFNVLRVAENAMTMAKTRITFP